MTKARLIADSDSKSFRNKIINGDFRINQRGYVSGSNLASGSYGFDRWKSNFTNTTLTFTSAPDGQALTINSGGGIEQVIESSNISAGYYVLSWAGTATGRVYNSAATPPSYAASPIVAYLTNTQNVEVEFTASGGTKVLQNVQLELGSVPSSFEYRPIGSELALCQRYYQVFEARRLNAEGYAAGAGYGYYGMVDWKVEMRAAPVVTLPTPSQTGNKTGDATSSTTDGFTYVFSSAAAGNAYILYNAGLKASASAEL
jgi:hypothetical protein